MYKNRFVIAVVLARVDSKRLEKKMLLPFLEFETIFECVLDRVSKCKLIDKVVVATSSKEIDGQLEKMAKKVGFETIRGSENDVVSRIGKAISTSEIIPQVIVRVCSDNPLLMPEIIDDAIMQLIDSDVDIVTPFELNTYPFGFSSVIMTLGCFTQINKKAHNSIYREHVENFSYDNQDRFSIGHQIAPDDLNCPNLCLTLDYEVDYDRLIMYGEAVLSLDIKHQSKTIIEKFNNAQVGIVGFDKAVLNKLVPPSVTLFEEKGNLQDRELDLVFSSYPLEILPKLCPPRGVIWPDSSSGELKCLYKSEKPFVVFKMEPKASETNTEYFVRVLPKAINILLAGPLRPFYAQHKTGEKSLHSLKLD